MRSRLKWAEWKGNGRWREQMCLEWRVEEEEDRD